MDVRNVQRTGDMHYVYLPTSWCKKNNISSKSKVGFEQNSKGTLLVSPVIVEKKPKELVLSVAEDNQAIIHKLIVACYINPLSSFKINLEKGMDFAKVLDQKKLQSLESVELEKNTITCDSVITISDPSALLKTMLRKIKNLLIVMTKNYNLELINRYEEEIDRTKLLIDKSVISALTHNSSSKLRTIDDYYISIISRDLERLVDHLIRIDNKELAYLNEISGVINYLKEIVEHAHKMSYKEAILLVKKIIRIPEDELIDVRTYDKFRINSILGAISDAIVDWAITNEVEKETK